MNGKVLNPVSLMTETFVWLYAACDCLSVSSSEGGVIWCVVLPFDWRVEEQ